MLRTIVRLGGSALLIAAGLSCDPKETDYFLTELHPPPEGNLTGLVSSGGTPINGATVALTGTADRSTTTGTDGIYNFTALPAGPYTVTPSATNFNCPASTATITAFQTTTLNLVCIPQVGHIDGTIRLNLQPQVGVLVTATQGSNNIGTATSAANGTYSITNLPPGGYTAVVTPPASSSCNPTQQNVTVQSNQGVTANFDCTSLPGSVSGTVLVNGSGQSGILVSVAQGGTTVGTSTTDAGGTYTVANLAPGTYSASITPPANTTCTSNPQTVTVQSNQSATANFACTSVPGSVTGTVTVDTSPRSGVTVTLTQGGTTIGSATTAAGGTYTIPNVPPGSYTATVTPPAGTTCSSNPKTVTVQANQAATASFDCTTIPNDFTVNLTDPAPSYRHIVAGVSSETCTGVSTTPAQPGGSWTTTWTGPGTVGTTTHAGTLDASGKAVDRQAINLLGTYNVAVSVTAGGTTKSANGSVVVVAAAGSCPPP